MDRIQTIGSFLEVLRSKRVFPQSVDLFRGQVENKPLLPCICRSNPQDDLINIEVEMLSELKRRTSLLIKDNLKDDWDWLIYAQHFGLKTKLLDWTTNPLIALWFAINDFGYIKEPSYLYSLSVNQEDYTNDEERKEGPFNPGKTKVLNPTLNNARIIAQQGWFTAHRYSNTRSQYLPLQKNSEIKGRIKTYEIDPEYKITMLDELNILGINYQTLFPDVMGVTNQINWEYLDRLY
jgi:hypothetical protein